MSKPDNGRPNPVFEAPDGRRRLIVRVSFVALLALCLGFALHFAWRVYALPALDPSPQAVALSISGGAPELATRAGPSLWAFSPDPDHETCGGRAGERRRQVVVYIAAGDRAGPAALARHCDRIDRVLVQSYELADADGSVRLQGDAALSVPAFVPVLDISPNLSTQEIATLLADPVALEGLSFRLGLLRGDASAGLCLNLAVHGDLPAEAVASALGRLAGDGPRCVIGSADAAFWESSDLMDLVDLAVVEGFREPTGPAESPAPEEWFVGALARAESLIPADKLVVALGTTGRAWRSGEAGLREITFAEAMTDAADHEANLVFVPRAGASRIRYVDGAGRLTEVWLPDAPGLQNQLVRLEDATAVAIWPLGSEDPAVWGLLDGEEPAETVLEHPVRLDHAVRIVGSGSFVSASVPGQAGQRRVQMDADGRRVIEATYDSLPSAGRLVRSGDDNGARLSLSFDRLPTEELWPELARVLGNAEVEATFVVTSQDLLMQGDVAAAIVAGGHVLGLWDDATSEHMPAVERMMDNLGQLLAADRTGLRPRFVEVGGDGEWADLAMRSSRLIEGGYIPVVPVATLSEEALTDPAAVLEALSDEDRLSGRIAIDVQPYGWDRVILSLPALLADLRALGYEFTSLRAEAKLEPVQAMPPTQEGLSPVVTASFAVAAVAVGGVNAMLLCFLILSAVRSGAYLILALLRRPRNDFDPRWQPPVTVIVPAFNEEKVIESCVASILSADYSDVRVVVVDDGSTDGTSDVVEAAFGDHPRVTLIRQSNRGKWAAANTGLAVTDTPIFLIADADSMFLPDTIGWLVQQFKDPKVGAVAGLVEVGNRSGLLARCQLLEYIVSQSVLRRAQETFNGIIVVPGAVGAWRTEAVRKAGLFSGETVTEDADLTIAVHRAGYEVRFQEHARSITEVPTTVRSFMRQRLRWTFGMFQASWKHRRAVTEGRTVGYISIVDAIWFGLLSGLLAPLVDLLLLLLLVQGAWALVSDGTAALALLPPGLLLAYFALTGLDLLNMLVAFRFERRFDWRLLLLVPVLRFGYRQLLYVATIQALVRAMTGTATGWNKLDRSGAMLSLWSRLRGPSDQPIDIARLPAGE